MSLARPTWLSVLFLVLSCAASREPGIMPKLLAHEPVCLTLDWGAGPRATFYSRPAPDTLVLLTRPKDRRPFFDNFDAWGLIELAPSQQDREGGGWVWWMANDTLNIRAENPTMDGLAIWSVQPDKRSVASWREFGLVSSEASEAGHVGLHPYECSGLPQSAP